MPEMYVTPYNPNAEQGGGDLCNPHKQVEDVEGPWVSFPAVDVAEHAGILTLPHASLPLSRLKEAVRLCEGVIPTDAGPGTQDIREQITARAEANADFNLLTDAEKEAFQAKWPGQVVKCSLGYVQVPPTFDSANREAFSLERIEKQFEPEPRQQVPGPTKGEYVDAIDPDEEIPEV